MKSDFIDREELIREIISDMTLFVGTPDEVQKHDEQCNYAISCIEDSPTADVVSVVRCETCKHWKHRLGDNRYCSCLNGLFDPDKFDFCSHGERRLSE